MVTLLRSNREESWSFQDTLIVHHPSGNVLTAYKDGSLHLAPRLSASRTSLPGLIFSRTAAVLDKLLTLIDLVKDIPLQSQAWDLTTEQPVRCPELGLELQDLPRGETFRHIRADTEGSNAVKMSDFSSFMITKKNCYSDPTDTSNGELLAVC